MNLTYKYCNHTFFISYDRVKNNALRTSLISSLRNAFKGFINDEECFDKSILHFSFTDDLDSLFKSKDFVFKNKTKVSDSQTYFSDDEISFIMELRIIAIFFHLNYLINLLKIALIYKLAHFIIVFSCYIVRYGM